MEQEDLETFVTVGQLMVEDLTDMAFSGNIQRPHHLASAIDCFEQAHIVLKAMEIAQDYITAISDDEPSASQDESSDDANDASHTSG